MDKLEIYKKKLKKYSNIVTLQYGGNFWTVRDNVRHYIIERPRFGFNLMACTGERFYGVNDPSISDQTHALCDMCQNFYNIEYNGWQGMPEIPDLRAQGVDYGDGREPSGPGSPPSANAPHEHLPGQQHVINDGHPSLQLYPDIDLRRPVDPPPIPRILAPIGWTQPPDAPWVFPPNAPPLGPNGEIPAGWAYLPDGWNSSFNSSLP